MVSYLYGTTYVESKLLAMYLRVIVYGAKTQELDSKTLVESDILHRQKRIASGTVV